MISCFVFPYGECIFLGRKTRGKKAFLPGRWSHDEFHFFAARERKVTAHSVSIHSKSRKVLQHIDGHILKGPPIHFSADGVVAGPWLRSYFVKNCFIPPIQCRVYSAVSSRRVRSRSVGSVGGRKQRWEHVLTLSLCLAYSVLTVKSATEEVKLLQELYYCIAAKLIEEMVIVFQQVLYCIRSYRAKTPFASLLHSFLQR